MDNTDVKQTISMEDLTKNISHLCRVCLTDNKALVPLNEKLSPNSNLLICECLSSIMNRKIIIIAEYPNFICSVCLRLLRLCNEFKLQINESYKILAKYYGQTGSCDLLDDTKLSQKDCPSVELISSQGAFDLKDIVVVESNDDNTPNYDGFLRNLGSQISATFVPKPKKKPLKPKNQIIDFPSSIETENKNIAIPCPVCKKIFARKKLLNRHMKDSHAKKDETFVCEICGLLLKTRSSHYHHMVKHEGKQHCCTICKKRYYSSTQLQLHAQSKHLNIRPHLCTICGKNFTYGSALTYHMRLHTGEKKFKCTYCDRTFTMGCGLKRHIATHTGIRNFKCQFCNKAYKSRGELLCHEMIHTGFRPYHCKYCEKSFIKSHNLKVHLMNHRGEHDCDMCNKNFVEVGYLKMHMKKAHGV